MTLKTTIEAHEQNVINSNKVYYATTLLLGLIDALTNVEVQVLQISGHIFSNSKGQVEISCITTFFATKVGSHLQPL